MPRTARTLLATDEGFEDRLPPNLQFLSSIHFTPARVAQRVAGLLAPEPGMTVLDVGAGAGKFCLLAAVAVPGAAFVGVELRKHLVDLASLLAVEMELANVRFVQGDAFDLDWSPFDAFYFYNPFAEHIIDRTLAIDEAVAHDPIHYITYVMAVRERLARARLGTRVATFYGYGGPLPLGYDLADVDTTGLGPVELWIKTSSRT